MNIWKISPGENAFQWPEWKEEGFMAIGWDDVGYIRGVSWEEFERRCQDLYDFPSSELKKQGVYQLWRFVNEIKPGDRIVANQGTRKILGIGTVTGELFWLKDAHHRHRFPVEWTDTQEYAVKEQGWTRTLIQLSDQKFQEIWEGTGNIWRIAPGKDAYLWPDCLAQGFMGIGWAEMGDIRQFTWEQFLEKAEEIYDFTKANIKKQGVYQLWRFVHEIKPGDQIVANQGISKVLGIGTVTGEIFWLEGADKPHRWPIKWTQTEELTVYEASWVKTLSTISPAKLHQLIQKPNLEKTKMTTQSLTAEFAIEQLKILCQDGDVSGAFPDFDRSSYDDEDISEDDNDDDVVVYRISEDCIADFVGMLAKSDWESAEEFFKFYEFVGYELFTTASDPELSDPSGYGFLKSPHSIKFSHYTLTSDGGYFDLYVRARELLKQDQENEKYAYERIKMPAQCDAEWEDITVMDLIPAATAYIWDHWEYLSNFSHEFDELQVEFWRDVICFLAVGYTASSPYYDSTAELGIRGIARAMSNSGLLEDLFYQSLGNLSYAYSQDCIDNFCDNESTTSNMLKTIALGAIGDFEKLVDLFRSYGSDLDDFQQQVEDYDWDTETILTAIKSHPNCTHEILEIITQYDQNKVDDSEEDDLDGDIAEVSEENSHEKNSMPLTAEFAIGQLKILCQGEDVSNTFPDFKKSSDNDDGVSEDDIGNFVGMLAKSDWESAEEFFKFYEFVGYELFTTASDPESKDRYYTSPNGLQFTHHTITSYGGYFDLYVRGYEFIKQKENIEYVSKLVEIPSKCKADATDINLINLIPAATAYIWNQWEYLCNHSGRFDEYQVDFWRYLTHYLGNGYVDDGTEEEAMRDISQVMHNSVVLEHVFYRSEYNTSYIYDQDCINNFCENRSTTVNILKTIVLAATGDFERLATELQDIFSNYGSDLDEFQDEVENYDWDTEEILEAVKSHPNCTDEIKEIIDQYEPNAVDEDDEDQDLEEEEDDDDNLEEVKNTEKEDSTEAMMLEIANGIYSEKVSIVDWKLLNKDPKAGFIMLVRELRRGWYLEMNIDFQAGKSSHRVFQAFLPVLDNDETVWHSITQNASESDWKDLDELMKFSWSITGARMFLAGPELVGAEVAEQALEEFGFYVRHPELLPVLIWENKELNLILLVYLKHPERFAGESMLTDNNTHKSEVFSSLTKSVQSLAQKANYYIQES